MSKNLFTFVVSDDNSGVFEQNIGRSKIYIDKTFPFVRINGFKKCVESYSSISITNSTYIAYVHNDVFFHEKFEEELISSIFKLNDIDCNWGVCGAAGVLNIRDYRSIKYPVSGGKIIAAKGPGYINIGCLREKRDEKWGTILLSPEYSFPSEISYLDECFLVIKNNQNLSFDTNIPYNHSYGLDICLQSQNKGMKNYVLPALIHHNCKSQKERGPNVDFELSECAKYIENKYPNNMPCITTSYTYGKNEIH